MRRIRNLTLLLLVSALSTLAGACAASTVSTQGASNYDGVAVENILVIGIAVDYEGRARFERKLASELKGAGVNATPLYTVGGGNKPIDRDAVQELVRANGYDSVLISRVLNRDSDASVKVGSSGAKAVRKDGRPVNLFRYDYEELNEPVTFNIDLSVTFTTELFEAVNNDKIWAIESTISKKEVLEDLINEAAETIVRRLKKDKLIAS